MLSRMGMSGQSLLAASIPKTIFKKDFRFQSCVRRFCQDKVPGREPYSQQRTHRSLKERAMGPPGPNAYSMGKGALAGGAIIGLGALCYYGIGMGNEKNALNQAKLWPKYVHERIRTTYLYLGGSIIISTLSTVGVFNTPSLLHLVTRQGILSVIGVMAAMVGTGIVAQMITYKEGLGIKQLAWAAHCAVMGAVIAPICFIGGPVLIRASMYTCGIVGGLSAVAVCAPSDKFLYMGGALAIGLGLLVAASLASIWLPPTTAIGAGISSFSLYGGLLIFSGFLLYDTQRIIHMAANYPAEAERPFDPVTAAISIYMDILNIFIRLALILGGDDGKGRR